MTIEAIPWGQREGQTRENPFSKIAQAVKTFWETSGENDPITEYIAAYLGIALSQEVLHSRMTREEVGHKFEEFGNSGLPIDRVTKSYRFFTARGMIIKWFDVNFQLETLERYMPEVFERSNRNDDNSIPS